MQNNKRPTIYFSTYDDIKNPYYGGGGAIAIHAVAKELSKKYDVYVLSWDYNGVKKQTMDGVQYERFGIASINPKIAMFLYQIMLPYIAVNKKFDVWIESFCPPFTSASLPLFIKKPVVGIVHMLAAEDMERKYKLPFHILQNIGIKKYHQLIVTSNELKEKVKKITSVNTIKVISNGIPSVEKPKIKKDKYILFLGRIEIDQKGIDLLVAAFKQFHVEYNQYKLIIAGSGDPLEISKLKKLIAEHKLEKNVILNGRVSGKTKIELLKNAACIVIPSRFETYSLVALEAMAYGAPVVTFSIDGLKWIPKGIAYKVKTYNISDLSKAIAVVVSDNTLTNKMIQEGSLYAKEFTWDKIAKQYDEYIKRLLSV